ncbi:hypothetical protein V492_06751 [Pseudogymnoascus sp. VKM F-4246]|nr:hypothetical protein V492_06751 [Pseudogymnoascus sp. VKM F-4246]
MASLIGTNGVGDHLLEDSESSDKKTQPAFYGSEVQQNGHTGAVKPQQLQRYWVRTLALILIPPIITAWYGVIWVRLILGIEGDDAVKYRISSGSLIYYSWFIIGVFGLSWGQFGLLGVEVAMLQTPFWKTPNLVATLMHSGTTWSGPSGWLKAIYHREFHRLWCLLAFISILPFIAFPLSGLVFEIGDGYVRTLEQPFVIGRNTTTYNNATNYTPTTPVSWAKAIQPIIPGFGVVYTAPGLKRDDYSCLQKTPNTLPQTESIPDMFIAPQADEPVSGEAWGLRLKYNCSVVRTASEFSILSEKHVSTFISVEGPHQGDWPSVKLQTPSGHRIEISNHSKELSIDNMWSYSEAGMSVPTAIKATYTENSDDNPADVPVDISESMVFEYALWQLQYHGYYDKANESFPFNSTLGTVVKGMGGPYFMLENKTLVTNDTFFKIGQGLNTSVTDLLDFFSSTQVTDYDAPQYPDPFIDVADPVGVRCVVSSGAGKATLDAVTSTFSNFKRIDPDRAPLSYTGGVFGHMAQTILSRTSFSNFYAPSRLPRELADDNGLSRYQGFIPSTGLLRSVMLAYGLDALELMYGVPSDPEKWVHTNLTSSREGKILNIASLIPGNQAGYLVMGLFCLWSGLSVVLGLVYGFRKRPSDKLDGYSMFKQGAEMADDLKHNDVSLRKPSFYGNKALKELPGR